MQANSPRPLDQALVELRRKYGWTVDYEEPLYGPRADRHSAIEPSPLKGGNFIARLRQPSASDTRGERAILQDLVNQYNDQFPVKFRLIKTGEGRFDIAPEKSSILDVPFAMDNQVRSLDEELDEILKRLSKAVGVPVERGGLVSGSPYGIPVKLEHENPTPARTLLVESLDFAGYQKLWILTYEPSMREFGIAIENSVRLEKSRTGLRELPVLNPRYAKQAR